MAGIKLSVHRLQPGLYIKLPLKWGEHPFMMSSFKLKSTQQISVIKKLGISYVIFFPDKSNSEPLPASETPDLQASLNLESSTGITEFEQQLEEDKSKKIEELKNYRRNIKKTEAEFNRSLSQVRALMGKVSSRPLNAIQEATELVDGIVELLTSGDNAILHLMDDNKGGDNLYYHALNVSVLSMILANTCGMEPVEIRMVGLGALFHEIGKLKIPPQILRKTEKLSAAESNFLKQHPRYSADLISHAQDLDEQVKLIVVQHHEMIDGSGYPAGLKGQKINRLAQASLNACCIG